MNGKVFAEHDNIVILAKEPTITKKQIQHIKLKQLMT